MTYSLPSGFSAVNSSYKFHILLSACNASAKTRSTVRQLRDPLLPAEPLQALPLLLLYRASGLLAEALQLPWGSRLLWMLRPLHASVVMERYQMLLFMYRL